MNIYVDVIVVGAGTQGLMAAKTSIACDSSVVFQILDSNASVGGAKAKEKIFSGLRSNNLLGPLDFTDLPMHAGFGVKEEEHIPSETLHEYSRQYAKEFDPLKRITFNTKVRTAEKFEPGWRLQDPSPRETHDQAPHALPLLCEKLILATGTASAPLPLATPHFTSLLPPPITFGSLPTSAPALLADPSTHRVAVVAGSKAAPRLRLPLRPRRQARRLDYSLLGPRVGVYGAGRTCVGGRGGAGWRC